MKIIHTDIVIVGSGIAGLAAALRCSEYGEVILICKDKLPECNTSKAQGGMAVPLSKSDSENLHIKDTVKTGAGICDRKAVRVLVNESKNMFNELSRLGLNFDKTTGPYGQKPFDLRREGAHSIDRIAHAKGDYTGREIASVLIRAVKRKNKIKIIQREFLLDLVMEKGKCRGVFTLSKNKNNVNMYSAKAVLIATGGIGQIYAHTSNSLVSTGDGIAAAYRAGARLADIEFVQFHPTVIYTSSSPSGYPEYLITEALRGEGAVLTNKYGEEFMSKYHAGAELSSRDIVTRAIFTEMRETKSDFVYLDISKVKNFGKKFPQALKTCRDLRIDLSKKRIPVIPTVHYFMGGIKVNLRGETNIPGLFAAGEAACTGAHGANRLASNSLTEAYVFGKRAAEEIGRYIRRINSQGSGIARIAKLRKDECILQKRLSILQILQCQTLKGEATGLTGNFSNQINKIAFKLKKTMWEKAGVFRCGKTLSGGLREVEKLNKEFSGIEDKIINRRGRIYATPTGINIIKFFELKNMLTIAELIIKSALARKESRGSHFRTDYPQRNDKLWKKHIVVAAGL